MSDFGAGLATVAFWTLPLLGLAVVVSAAYLVGYRRGYFLGDRDRARANVREAVDGEVAARLADLLPVQRAEVD